MNPQLENLCLMQDLDIRIRNLDQGIAKVPVEIDRLKQELQKEEASWESAKAKVDDFEKKRREKERELDSAEAKLDKYNSQLLSVKTNKEYTAMLHEIDQVKDEISKIEEDILIILDQTEDLQDYLKQEKISIEEKRRAFDEGKNRLEKVLSSLKGERDALFLERGKIDEDLDNSLKMEYQKLCQARKGIAVARARNEACEGCNIKLMPQLFQEIKNYEDRIFRCPSCHRFLFYKEDGD
ncbi:hypothetical protein JXL19_03200 [bacterium]|nr:hypothetical protein [bacterium]